jgi:transposase InsO family protein
MVKALLDSGASKSLIKASLVKKLRIKPSPSTVVWTTAAGKLDTKEKCSVEFMLPELSPSQTCTWDVHLISEKASPRYDMIIGRDLLKVLGIQINFSEEVIRMGTAEIPMRTPDVTVADAFYYHTASKSEELLNKETILDSDYKQADLRAVVQSADHLSPNEQEELYKLLKRFEDLFDGTLGQYKGSQYKIELRDDATPYHLRRPYSVPRAYEATFKKEIERLCQIGVLRKINRSEWAAGTFIIPKKDMKIRVISDFRELNKRIKRKPYPIPKIQTMLTNLEGFSHASSIDLNMGYYHIELTPASKQLCTIVLPWGKYEYQKLPMGLCNSADVFQECMSDLMMGLEFCRVYIDDLLVINKGSWQDHLQQLEKVFGRLQSAGFKINADKSFFGRPALDYLGYWVTREGITPQPKKIDAIRKMTAPTNRKELRRFIGMVNFYRDMWIRRSELMTPLSNLTSKAVKWQWTKVENDAFEALKRLIGREVLLSYPDFSKPFEIHTDASDYQLGAVIHQDNKPIAFYSKKLNSAQRNYTTTEKELLSIVATLNEFENILLGHEITVYTDHKNLTYKDFNSHRVIRQRMALERFGVTLNYVRGEDNVVADALSRLHFDDESHYAAPYADAYDVTTDVGYDKADVPPEIFPLKFNSIAKAQAADAPLIAKLQGPRSNYTIQSFRGGGKTCDLITKHGKIVIPKSQQRAIVHWYHTTLCHPGETRTEQTIRQNLWWLNLRDDVHDICKKCPTCQLNKKHLTKYGFLPEKEAEGFPWEILCVDLIGPYTFKRKGKSSLRLWCVTMIDPATGWFEIREIPDKESGSVANLVETAWMTRYPWPNVLNFDRGTEFMGDFARMAKLDYGIKRKPITTRNPQANAIIERIHQTLGNILRTFEYDELDESDPWSGILAAASFAVRATYHTTTQATPMQLVFGRDAILNIKHVTDWEAVRARKQKKIRENNMRENSKRINHAYSVGDRILLRTDQNKAKFDPEWKGPYVVTAVNRNGTVRYVKGALSDSVNIRQVRPYHESV